MTLINQSSVQHYKYVNEHLSVIDVNVKVVIDSAKIKLAVVNTISNTFLLKKVKSIYSVTFEKYPFINFSLKNSFIVKQIKIEKKI